MPVPTSTLPELQEWGCDPQPLLDCIGTGVEGSFPGLVSSGAQVRCAASLESFLFRYARESMLPLELPRIREVALLASASQFREIIALDGPDGGKSWDPIFLSASRRVGRSQLRRMRPLKDLKGLVRYREAVEQGKALGTHTVVYGIMLGVYSIPLRQGLSHYVWQTLHSLADSGADRLGLMGENRKSLHHSLDSDLHEPVQSRMNQLLVSSFGVV